jgi:pyruvate/2-oxoglutarate dehydrogenase complex dihydrolipoamide dehydrogenase (E3) component
MGIVESYHKAMPPMCIPRAAYVHLAQGIKEVVDVPVITVGRINDPCLAEQILVEEKADLVAMGRALFADPELPNKSWRGDFEDIVPCIACNRCEMATSRNVRVRCAVNPNLGMEREYKLDKVKRPKKILVAGGGPAGMTAATIAALRGHRVTLFEMQDKLGGQLILGGTPPHKDEINGYTEYLTIQARKSGMDVILGVEVKPELVEKYNPDAVIVATGAVQIIPRIPGVSGLNVVTAWDVLRGQAKVNGKVLVVGGGMVGCETAEYIASNGNDVEVVEMLSDIGLDMEPFSKVFLMERLQDLKVNIHTSVKVDKIDQNGVEATGINGVKHIFNADKVVIAVGSSSNDQLYKTLIGKVKEIYSIGDCKDPSKILEAVHYATYIAHKI